MFPTTYIYKDHFSLLVSEDGSRTGFKNFSILPWPQMALLKETLVCLTLYTRILYKVSVYAHFFKRQLCYSRTTLAAEFGDSFLDFWASGHMSQSLGGGQLLRPCSPQLTRIRPHGPAIPPTLCSSFCPKDPTCWDPPSHPKAKGWPPAEGGRRRPRLLTRVRSISSLGQTPLALELIQSCVYTSETQVLAWGLAHSLTQVWEPEKRPTPLPGSSHKSS